MVTLKALSRFAAVCAGLLGVAALASSHREAPLISNDPAADGTDLYAWRNNAATAGGTPTVTMVANYWPLALGSAGPNFMVFDDNVLYEIKVDNNQDGKPDIIYQFRFKTTVGKSPLPYPPAAPGDTFLNFFPYPSGISSPTDPNIIRYQTWTLTKVTIPANGRPTSTVLGSARVCPWYVGVVTNGNGTTDNYETTLAPQCNTTLGSAKVFVGPRDDPFFVDLHRTFDFLGYLAPGARPLGDDLAGSNVLSLVVEVPATDLTAGGAAITDGSHAAADQLGFWTTASRPRVRVHRHDGSIDVHGGWVQVSRLGNPLINEVVVPLAFKDFYNASKPANDVANYGAVVLDPEIPYLMNAKGFIPKVPPAPRTDLIAALLAPSQIWAKYTGTPDDVLHLDVSVPQTATDPATCTGACSPLGVINVVNGAPDAAGFPNGRRLFDRVTDIELSVLGGVAYKLLGAQDAGDSTDYATAAAALLNDKLNPSANDVPFQSTFPYLANPTPADN